MGGHWSSIRLTMRTSWYMWLLVLVTITSTHGDGKLGGQEQDAQKKDEVPMRFARRSASWGGSNGGFSGGSIRGSSGYGGRSSGGLGGGSKGGGGSFGGHGNSGLSSSFSSFGSGGSHGVGSSG